MTRPPPNDRIGHKITPSRNAATATVLQPDAQMYDGAVCSLPGCGKPLHIVYTSGRPVFLSDTAADLGTDGAYTQSWYVECEGDHRILVPADTAEDSYEFGRCRYEDEHDECDMGEECPHRDFDRLRAVIGEGVHRP